MNLCSSNVLNPIFLRLCCIVSYNILPLKHYLKWKLSFQLFGQVTRHKRNKSKQNQKKVVVLVTWRCSTRTDEASQTRKKAACGPTVISPCRDTSALQTEPSDESHFYRHPAGRIPLWICFIAGSHPQTFFQTCVRSKKATFSHLQTCLWKIFCGIMSQLTFVIVPFKWCVIGNLIFVLRYFSIILIFFDNLLIIDIFASIPLVYAAKTIKCF